MVSSELAKVEVPHACRRLSPAVPAAKTLLASIDLIPLTGRVLDQAADVGEPMLRSLDAIHLVSALLIRAELSGFVAYDHRLNEAAATAGLQVISPGR